MQGVSIALRRGPAEFLGLASTLITVMEPAKVSPFGAPEPAVNAADLLESFLGVDRVETTALLAAFARLAADEITRARIRRELQHRAQVLPGWLADLDAAAPQGKPVALTHVLGDGDNVMLGLVFADGRELTAVIYIDHNMGTLVKDAFVLPGPLRDVTAQFLTITDDPDSEAHPVEPAEARARITAAIELGAISLPPFETDTWPACRPLIEWMTAMLPAGGRGYERPQWSEADQTALADRFFASVFGRALDDEIHRDMLGHVLWFATGYGPGDPLRWSSVAAEIVLLDFIPRKIADSVPNLAVAPDLLRAYVRFCHAERGIRAELTAQTIATIDACESQYQELIREPRLQGPAALLAAMGALSPEAAAEMLFDPDLDMPEYEEYMLEVLGYAVGGEAALDALDDAPLPDEPFAWASIPADIHDRVGEVLALTEACCSDLLDEQYRTVTRRLLADAAATDPQIFRRPGRAETTAAALCWIAGKANSLFDHTPVRPKLTYVKDLTEYFGLTSSSVSQRAAPFLRAIGVNPHEHYAGMDLGSPRYLTAARRAHLIETRDRFRAAQAAAGR